MAVLTSALIRPEEGTLQGVGVDKLELPVHDYSGCGLLGFLDGESAPIEVKVVAVFTH